MPYADPEKRRDDHHYRKENREKKREYNRQYYEANREKHLEKARQWQLANPEKRREHSRRWRAKLRAQVLELLGGKCARCGFNDPRILQVDHINGGGNAEVKSLGYYGILRKVLADPTGYQLLCPTCNWRKRVERGETRRGRVNHENPNGQASNSVEMLSA